MTACVISKAKVICGISSAWGLAPNLLCCTRVNCIFKSMPSSPPPLSSPPILSLAPSFWLELAVI